MARCLSNTFAGIRPLDVAWFIRCSVPRRFRSDDGLSFVPSLPSRAKDVLLALSSLTIRESNSKLLGRSLTQFTEGGIDPT